MPSDSSARVLVADSISDAGVALLRATPGLEVAVQTGMNPGELSRCIGGFDALIVRSATKVTAAALAEPGRLRAIGRAGTGVDNIDLDAATRAGVVVMNTPGGNSMAAAELTLALLLALARNVPQANADLRQGRWERKKYVGDEIAGKVLGVVGLGRIGREVARLAQGFRMQVLGHDPYVSADAAESLGVHYRKLDELIRESDYITLHIPKTDETRHLLDAKAIGSMRTGARIINCARGGLIDETALVEALDAGHLAGAALDVFESEPPTDARLVAHPKIVSTPHLGASTHEAQERVGTEIAEKIRDFLQRGVILDAVNFPSIGRKEFAALGPLMDLAARLGTFLAQIVDGGFKRLEVSVQGGFTEHPLKPLVMAATKGLLGPLVVGGVSYVNALALADARGIAVAEASSTEPSPYSGLLRLRLVTERESAAVAGTLLGPARPRLVEVDGVPIESFPAGQLLFIRNRDLPGVVGKIGTLLGQAEVNIAGIQLGRLEGTDRAVSILGLDGPVPQETLRAIRALPEIVLARAVTV
jgi:D-3-phosphoglycerate dehydrogenase